MSGGVRFDSTMDSYTSSAYEALDGSLTTIKRVFLAETHETPEHLTRPSVPTPYMAKVYARADVESEFASFAERVDRSVIVVGRAGCGKTKFGPRALADAVRGKMAVVLLAPSQTLASDASAGIDHLHKKGSSVFPSAAKFAVAVDRAVGSGEVVLATTDEYVAGVANGVKLPTHYLIHDEAHLSDYVTYVLRTVGPDLPNVAGYCAMTATLTCEFEEERRHGAPAVTSEVLYDASVEGVLGAVRAELTQRHEGRIPGILVIEARAERRKALRNALKHEAYVLDVNAESTYDELDEARRCLSVRRNEPVLVLSDETTRAGFTLDVGCVVDTGTVRETMYMKNKLVDYYRKIQKHEYYQSRERVGRVSSGKHVCVEGPFEEGLTMLNPGEMEHAQALMSALGFQVPRTIASRVKSVPEDGIGFLASGLPCPAFEAQVRVAPRVRKQKPSETVASARGGDTPSSRYFDERYPEHAAHRQRFSIFDDIDIDSLEEEEVDPIFPDTELLFPGVIRVFKKHNTSHGTIDGYTDEQRNWLWMATVGLRNTMSEALRNGDAMYHAYVECKDLNWHGYRAKGDLCSQLAVNKGTAGFLHRCVELMIQEYRYDYKVIKYDPDVHRHAYDVPYRHREREKVNVSFHTRPEIEDHERFKSLDSNDNGARIRSKMRELQTGKGGGEGSGALVKHKKWVPADFWRVRASLWTSVENENKGLFAS